MGKQVSYKVARRVGVTKLGVKATPKRIVVKPSHVPPPPAPKPALTFRTFEEYRGMLLAMDPIKFEHQLRALNANVAAGTVNPAYKRAFDEVGPIQQPRIEAAYAERERARIAEMHKPPALSEDEKKVEAGTHRWVCEHQKCGGKGQLIAGWSVVPVSV